MSYTLKFTELKIAFSNLTVATEKPVLAQSPVKHTFVLVQPQYAKSIKDGEASKKKKKVCKSLKYHLKQQTTFTMNRRSIQK